MGRSGKVLAISLGLVLALWMVPGLALADGDADGQDVALEAQETNNTKSNATNIAVNKAITSSLTSSGDDDWYKFTLSEDGPLELVFDSSKRDNAQLGWNVRLQDSGGSGIWSGWFMCSSTQASSLVTTGLPAGDYYVLVDTGTSPSSYTSAQYSLTAKFSAASDWETEFNESKASADPLALNKARKGGLRSSGDDDWYKFTLSEDGPLELVFDSSKRDNAQLGWNVRLQDSGGSGIWSGWFKCDESQSSSLVKTDLPAGDYYVLVDTGTSPSSYTPAFYTIKARTDFSVPKSGEMQRLYNPNSGEHFYTADTTERDNLTSAGWTYEGIGWTAPENKSLPVYRMYNPVAGEHHYTPDASERDSLIEAGWNDEGIGWYSAGEDGVPLYRDYNPNAFANNHNYTASWDEHAALAEAGWIDEGIAWYGV